MSPLCVASNSTPERPDYMRGVYSPPDAWERSNFGVSDFDFRLPGTAAPSSYRGSYDHRAQTGPRQSNGSMEEDYPWSPEMKQSGSYDRAHVPALKWQFYKTKLCPWHARDSCFKGDACHFAHGEDDLRLSPNLQKTRMCIHFMKDKYCREGIRCNFAHGLQELRATANFWKTKLCPLELRGKCLAGKNCRYAHSKEELRAPYRSSSSGRSLDSVSGSGRCSVARSFSSVSSSNLQDDNDGSGPNMDCGDGSGAGVGGPYSAPRSPLSASCGNGFEFSPQSSASTMLPYGSPSLASSVSWGDESTGGMSTSTLATPKTYPITAPLLPPPAAAAAQQQQQQQQQDLQNGGGLGERQQKPPRFAAAQQPAAVNGGGSSPSPHLLPMSAPAAAAQSMAAYTSAAAPQTSAGPLQTFHCFAAFPTAQANPSAAQSASTATWIPIAPSTATAAFPGLTGCFVLPAATATAATTAAAYHTAAHPTQHHSQQQPQQQHPHQQQQWAALTPLPSQHQHQQHTYILSHPQQQAVSPLPGTASATAHCVAGGGQQPIAPQQQQQHAAGNATLTYMQSPHTAQQQTDFKQSVYYYNANVPNATGGGGSGTSTPSTSTAPQSPCPVTPAFAPAQPESESAQNAPTTLQHQHHQQQQAVLSTETQAGDAALQQAQIFAGHQPSSEISSECIGTDAETAMSDTTASSGEGGGGEDGSCLGCETEHTAENGAVAAAGGGGGCVAGSGSGGAIPSALTTTNAYFVNLPTVSVETLREAMPRRYED